MKRSNVLVTVGDGIDPRSEELKAQSKAIAEAGRSGNAEEVRSDSSFPDGESILQTLTMRFRTMEQMFTPKQSGKSTAVVRFWRTDQQDRDGKPKLLQQVPIFAKKVSGDSRTLLYAF